MPRYNYDIHTKEEARRVASLEKAAFARRTAEKERIAREGNWRERLAVQIAERGYGVPKIVKDTAIPEQQARLIVSGAQQ
jgi:hypothetical protein